jgi:hypothetical protein
MSKSRHANPPLKKILKPIHLWAPAVGLVVLLLIFVLSGRHKIPLQDSMLQDPTKIMIDV